MPKSTLPDGTEWDTRRAPHMERYTRIQPTVVQDYPDAHILLPGQRANISVERHVRKPLCVPDGLPLVPFSRPHSVNADLLGGQLPCSNPGEQNGRSHRRPHDFERRNSPGTLWRV